MLISGLSGNTHTKTLDVDRYGGTVMELWSEQGAAFCINVSCMASIMEFMAPSSLAWRMIACVQCYRIGVGLKQPVITPQHNDCQLAVDPSSPLACSTSDICWCASVKTAASGGMRANMQQNGIAHALAH